MSPDQLRYYIHKALKYLCISNGEDWGHNVCVSTGVSIPNIAWNDNGKYRQDAYFFVFVEREQLYPGMTLRTPYNYIPKRYGRDLIAAFIYLISEIYAAESHNNYYHELLTGTNPPQWFTWSKVGRRVEVMTDKENGHMRVQLWYNGVTLRNEDFKCERSISDATELVAILDSSLCKGFRTPMGWLNPAKVWCKGGRDGPE